MNTTEDITNYSLVNKRMTGTTLKLFFKQEHEGNPQKVLELLNVAAFIDNFKNQELEKIEINDSGGSYGVDMSLRLKRPEIQKFYEVFIFCKEAHYHPVFRALAEDVSWRNFDNQQLSDLNY